MNSTPNHETEDDLREIINENINYRMLLNWFISKEDANSKPANKCNKFRRFDKRRRKQVDLDNWNNSTTNEEVTSMLPP